MGAACGRPNKMKSKTSRQTVYLNVNSEPDNHSKSVKDLNSERGLVPAPAHDNDIVTPLRPISATKRDTKDWLETGRKQTEDDFDNLLSLKALGTARNDSQAKFSIRINDAVMNLDQASKTQPKPLNNDRVDKPKALTVNYLSYGNLQNTENMFEPAFDEETNIPEDYYLDMEESFIKEYELFMSSTKPTTLRNPGSIPKQGQRASSQLLEWSKLLQKQFSQEKTPNAPNENKNKFYKIYKTILNLDERNWYEEIVSLYKEKQGMSKNTGNMTGLTFDRKIIQLQEQFRWLVSAVANVRLNPNNTVAAHEFPPYRMPGRKKGEKSEISASIGRNHNSIIGSDDSSDTFSPMRQYSHLSHLSLARSQIGGFTYLEKPPDPRQNYYTDLPDMFSPAWQEGFLWKGVYFKLYSKIEAQTLKKELKVLKHMGVEYLQTETNFKINDFTPTASIQGNESAIMSNQRCNVLLPLISTVESSSWILLGTPMFSIKKGSAQDLLPKLSLQLSNLFKNSFLLNTMTTTNFKIYHKAEDTQGMTNMPTFGSIGQSTHPPNTNISNSLFLLLNNVSQSAVTLPEVKVMMIISQENDTPITFLEYPQKGLDAEIVKVLLGYADENIDIEILLVNKKSKAGEKATKTQSPQGLHFELIKLKRRGWSINMVYVTSDQVLPPTFALNKRATDLLASSETNKLNEIRGNVLVFGYLPNKNSLINPYFISEQTFASFASGVAEGQPGWEGPDNTLVPKKNSKAVAVSNNSALQSKLLNPSQVDFGSFGGSLTGRESILRGNPKIEKKTNDQIIPNEFFLLNIGKLIDSVVAQLETTDTILNFASLRDLFHRKGVNMRFEWIVYAKLKREKTKALVGADILARTIKTILNEETNKTLKSFKRLVELGQSDVSSQKKKLEEIIKDKTSLFSEELYKKSLCHYINILTKDNFETVDDEISNIIFQDLATDLFLHRLRVIDIAKKSLENADFDYFMSSNIVKKIINIPCLNANTFFEAISFHTKTSVQYDILRQIRNDKYAHWVSNPAPVVKPSDFSILFTSDYYLTTRERCFLLLLKFLPVSQGPTPSSIELIVPSSLYKIRRPRYENELQVSSFDCFLHEYYEVPDLEVLNDWIVLLESTLNGLYTIDAQQNLLIEGYLIQLVLAFFGEGDYDNQLAISILEKINSLVNNTPLSSPEMIIAIHTWYGILAEDKLFADCEQSYAVALLVLHKLYGDPRGRGNLSIPWELFITWRLSILARLQGKIHDAEYVEELFDATLMAMKDNPLNIHLKSHYIYSNPLKAFESNVATGNQQNRLSHLTSKASLKTSDLGEHPFTHWVNHLAFNETVSKIDTINSTLHKTPQLLKWMINHMPLFQSTGILWETMSMREFFLSIMQNSFNNFTSVSSVSNNSIEKGKDKSLLGLDLSNNNATPKGYGSKEDRKDKKFGLNENLIHILEKDSSTFNKREINGTIYSWGQNDKGQVGTPITSIEDTSTSRPKKIRIYYPKRLITLKDTIIQSIACGHSHSMAVTLDGQLLAWGDNKYSQLGLGPNTPSEVYVPTVVMNLKDVASVSCGHEFTVALTRSGHVYSWGEGEEGLLGHGDTALQSVPKRIEALRDAEIQSVVCGGLHTLALTKQGYLYVWGKGEGGQLGIPMDQLIKNPADNHLYLTSPKRIRSALDGLVVVQIACGDAHSLALTQKGLVYSWGYTYQGQLGLGITSENIDPNFSCQIPEPMLVENLANVKITQVYAGATFSLFLSDKKELYGCGLNESNQLGIEKNTMKTNYPLERISPASASKASESAFPVKLDCFTSMPVLNVACGEAHSLALVVSESSYMLYSWGMQKQGQLGTGDTNLSNSGPRPISFLKYVMAYSMGCGAYHSAVVLGEPSKVFRKEALVERLEKKSENKWALAFFDIKGSYESMIEMAVNQFNNGIANEDLKPTTAKITTDELKPTAAKVMKKSPTHNV